MNGRGFCDAIAIPSRNTRSNGYARARTCQPDAGSRPFRFRRGRWFFGFIRFWFALAAFAPVHAGDQQVLAKVPTKPDECGGDKAGQDRQQ